jgi:hypothetical protein
VIGFLPSSQGFNTNPDCLYVKALCLYFKDSQDLAAHFLKEVVF